MDEHYNKVLLNIGQKIIRILKGHKEYLTTEQNEYLSGSREMV